MSGANEETEPLLSKQVQKSPPEFQPLSTEKERTCSRLRKCFLVEPVLILYSIGAFPVSIISQKYVIDWITANSLDFYDAENDTQLQQNTSITPCLTNTSDPDYQFQQQVQSESSQFALYESLLSNIPALFVTILLGAGSDHLGRRFAIIPPLCGVFLGGAITTLIIWMKAPIYWLFVRDFIQGCSGSVWSVMLACFAYVADRTPPERRLIRIVVVEMCMVTAGALSPIIVGKVTMMFGYLYPLLFVVAVSVINLSYVVLFFPSKTRLHKEALQEASNSTSCEQPSSFLSILWNQVCSMASIFFSRSPSSSHPWRRLKLNLLMTAFLVTNLPTFDTSVSTLFEMNSPLCWNLDTIGLFQGVALGVSSVGALILAPLLKLCHTPDYVIAIVAGLASLANALYKVFVKTTLMMFLSVSVAMLQIMFFPSLRSLLSTQVNEDQQGAVFGSLAFVEVICSMLGTVIFNSIYSATLFISTSFVFLVMAVFYTVGCLLVCSYAVLLRLEARRMPIYECQSVNF